MSKHIISLFCFSIILFGLSIVNVNAHNTTPEAENNPPASLQEAGTAVNPQTNTEQDLDNRRETISSQEAGQTRLNQALEARSERQELRQLRQQELTETRQQRIKNLAANLSNRLDAAIARLFQIVGRIETRLTKLESAGADISTARASLRRASANLTEARSLMSNIDTQVNDATTSNTPYLAWQPVREHYVQVAELVRQAHRELRQTIAEAKDAVTALDDTRGTSDAVRSETSYPIINYEVQI